MQLSSLDSADLASALRALKTQYTQDSRLLRLYTAAGADALIVERVDGEEVVTGLPQPAAAEAAIGFRFEVLALSPDATLNPDTLLGTAARLDLLTADSRTDLRPFHGYVTEVEQLGSNGGLARYRLVLEPWLKFLEFRHDAYVFQDQTVLEIIDELLGDYAQSSGLDIAWIWRLQDRAVYRKRSLTQQFRENDLAFLLRLLAEEGLYGWFEHTGGDGDSTGRHTLVLGDHNAAFVDIGTVRFHRADATERGDSLQRLDAVAAVGTHNVALSSWDYVSRDIRAVADDSADDRSDDGTIPTLTWREAPGPYAYADRDHGQRRARLQARALAVARSGWSASGTLRRLGPGCRLRVTDHARIDAAVSSSGAEAADFLALSVRHSARNNLPVDFSQALDRLLGDDPFAPIQAPTKADGPLYHNRCRLLPAALPYAPAARAKPRVSGVQTAIVVGNDHQPVTTDRDHRIKVQFHWQRGARSQSRLDPPDNSDNAPGTAAAGTWVRVAAPVAGPNWGGVLIPSVGQEVLLEFIEGDIDRPVVIGSLYNGQGQTDAAGNRIGQAAPAASANAPAWYAGTDHPGALSGFKTQALSSRGNGQGGYSQLLIDDTPGQARLDLATTQHQTQMTLGSARQHGQNARGTTLGHGNQLGSAAYGAFRAGEGLLISADARPGGTHGSAPAFDAREAIQQLTEAETLAQALAETAKKQNADVTPRAPPDAAASLAAIAALKHSQTVLSGHNPGAGLAWAEPMLAVSAPAGIVAVTPDASLWSAGSHMSQSAGHSIETLAQGGQHIAVKDGIVLYTHGAPAAPDAPEPLTGLQLHAAQGPVSLHAQSNTANLNAQHALRIASTTGTVELAARESLLLTAQGAYIRLQGGNIEIHAPGNVQFKGMKQIKGPVRVPTSSFQFPKAKLELKDFTRTVRKDYPASK
ncbi:MAG: type VI secretion system tip protein VgrG [Nevskia sp.]|jgi:type VI secretion system VgrG family protein|nr:type VI secretion system tip protein VgrG [Nevskia sp.]